MSISSLRSISRSVQASKGQNTVKMTTAKSIVWLVLPIKAMHPMYFNEWPDDPMRYRDLCNNSILKAFQHNYWKSTKSLINKSTITY